MRTVRKGRPPNSSYISTTEINKACGETWAHRASRLVASSAVPIRDMEQHSAKTSVCCPQFPVPVPCPSLLPQFPVPSSCPQFAASSSLPPHFPAPSSLSPFCCPTTSTLHISNTADLRPSMKKKQPPCSKMVFSLMKKTTTVLKNGALADLTHS